MADATNMDSNNLSEDRNVVEDVVVGVLDDDDDDDEEEEEEEDKGGDDVLQEDQPASDVIVENIVEESDETNPPPNDDDDDVKLGTENDCEKVIEDDAPIPPPSDVKQHQEINEQEGHLIEDVTTKDSPPDDVEESEENVKQDAIVANPNPNDVEAGDKENEGLKEDFLDEKPILEFPTAHRRDDDDDDDIADGYESGDGQLAFVPLSVDSSLDLSKNAKFGGIPVPPPNEGPPMMMMMTYPYISRAAAIAMGTAEDADSKVDYSVLAGNQDYNDDVSSLGGSMVRSIIGGTMVQDFTGFRTTSSVTFDVEDPRRNHDDDDVNDEDTNGIKYPSPWTSNTQKDAPPPIEIVSTQDTSNELDESKDISESGSNYRRLAYLACLIMGPVLVATIIGLAVLLSDVQGEDSKVGVGSNALSDNLPDMTESPSQQIVSSPPTISSILSPSPSSTPVTASPTGMPKESSVPTFIDTPMPTPVPTVTTPSPTVTTPFPTFAPETPSPTTAPTTSSTSSPTVAATEELTPEPTDPVVEPFQPMGLPPYPEGRFVPWSSVSSELGDDDDWFSVAIGKMGFTESNWEVPYPDEQPSSLSFTQARFTSNSADAAMWAMGVETSASWNCWINHYFFADWDELPRMPGPEEGKVFSNKVGSETDFGLAIQRAYETLGWTSERWHGGSSNYPASESQDWDELNSAEQAAAKQVCWTRATWNRVPISSW